MWPLPPLKQQLFQVILYSDKVVCSFFKKNKNTQTIKLFGYAEHRCTTDKTVIYDTQKLFEHIHEFISSHKLKHSYMQWILTDGIIQHACITHQTSNATISDLIKKQSIHRSYKAHHIGSDGVDFFWYVHSISEPLLLQLKMLCMRLPIHLHSIQTSFLAQLELYSFLYPTHTQAHRIQTIDTQTLSIRTLNPVQLTKNHAPQHLASDPDTLSYALGAHVSEESNEYRQ